MCVCHYLYSKQYVSVDAYVFIFPPASSSQSELVRHILLRIPAKTVNAAAKTALLFYPVMSIFCNN